MRSRCITAVLGSKGSTPLSVFPVAAHGREDVLPAHGRSAGYYMDADETRRKNCEKTIFNISIFHFIRSSQ